MTEVKSRSEERAAFGLLPEDEEAVGEEEAHEEDEEFPRTRSLILEPQVPREHNEEDRCKERDSVRYDPFEHCFSSFLG